MKVVPRLDVTAQIVSDVVAGTLRAFMQYSFMPSDHPRRNG